jgi:predicted DsbA family dithiol-disulfide isomerase
MARFPLVDFSLLWTPYELVPTSTEHAHARRSMRKVEAYLGFMGEMGKVRAYFARLTQEGRATGIEFEFEGRTSSTFDAHRLSEWCAATKGVAAQDMLIEAQFIQYFELGQPPSSMESQLAAASAAGLDVEASRAVLMDPTAYANTTRQRMDHGRCQGVRGVPSFRIDGREVACGAQSVDWWEHTLRQQLYIARQH